MREDEEDDEEDENEDTWLIIDKDQIPRSMIFFLLWLS